MSVTLPDCLLPSAFDGVPLLKDIEDATNKLARLMAQAHGGKWRVQVEHEAGLIVIARRCRT